MSRGSFTTPAPHSSVLESAGSAWLDQALEKHAGGGEGSLAGLGKAPHILLLWIILPRLDIARDKPAEYRSVCR